MPRRRSSSDTTPFDTLRLEGTLFVPELLERAARGEATAQKEADYGVPKGLKLHDEYGRAYRIATALWQDFAPQLPRTDLDPAKATHAFVLDLLRQCLGYTDLTPLSAPVQLGDRGFPITAQALGGRLPVIIAPHSIGLDDPDPRFAVHGAGARRKSAHQLAQEFLNASRDCLWAIVTNGRNLRLLRDAETLTRPNFLEFDLETILREGEDRYADFSALWRILHASRAGTATTLPADCIWEKWKTEGHAQGLRVREGLRAGVTQALLILGQGFLTHPDNTALRQRLHDGTLTKEDYFQQLLRLIYRSLFLFCAEERDLLHTPAPSSAPSVPSDPSVLSAHTAARSAYATGYSLRRLRNRSLRQAALTGHGDLWQGQTIVFRALATGQPRLALPALGGLFGETQCPDLDSAALTNRDLLAAMRQLRWSSASGSLTAIDYRNMGPEELGSVYESLLELVPQLDLPARTFGFAGITDTASTSGNARKTTGSYYTPDSLVQELIKSALDPVIADRLAEAGRLANGEWRTANGWMPFEQALNQPEFVEYAHRILSRSGNLAASQGSRENDLPGHGQISSRGEIRSDLPDAPGSGLDAVQHRGGLGTALSGGVHSIPAEGEWQFGRTGNTIPALHGPGVSDTSGGGPRSPGDQDPGSANLSPGAEFASQKWRTVSGGQRAVTDPFTVHQSPFASLPFAERKHIVATLWSQTPFAVRHSLFTCEALLRITVCDPSCGSGHFLLAAARRLAEKLAELRAPDGAVRPDDYRHALREVASRCLYGVDINPMAVELCRVALWLETVDPGKPLGFLNHHIRTGNSLLGTTPDLIAAGLPDDTFTAIEGDDKAACAELKKRNKKEREGFGPLFEKEEQTIRDRLRHAATQIEAMDDSQPAALQQKEAAFTTSETAPEYRHAKLLADLWCAAFVIKKTYPAAAGESQISNPQSQIAPVEGHLLHTQDELFGQPTAAPAPAKASKQPRTKNQEQGTASGITTGTLRSFVQGQALPEALEKEVTQLASQYRFFHWHLAFPQVFDQGGFSCILGNPPWEKLQIEEVPFFSKWDPIVAGLAGAKRKSAIAALETRNPILFERWKVHARQDVGSVHFIRTCNKFPLTGAGKFNSFALFAELNRFLTRGGGRVGCILPSGIASDDSTKLFFQEIVERAELASLFDFENKGLFPGVHSSFKFCLLTTCTSTSIKTNADDGPSSDFVFFAHGIEDIYDDAKRFTLTASDIKLVNPVTLTCPVFRSSRDAELTKFVHKRIPVFVRDESSDGNPWRATLCRMLNMTDDSYLFRSSSDLVAQGWTLHDGTLVKESHDSYGPLYEAKMFHQYDHRWATHKIDDAVDIPLEEKKSPDVVALPRHWVPLTTLTTPKEQKWNHGWLLAYRDITNTTNERTVIAAILPRVPLANTAKLIYPGESVRTSVCSLVSNLSGFALDYFARQKIAGTHLTLGYLQQIPVLAPTIFQTANTWNGQINTINDWLLPRVLELTYTAWDLEAFAADCGWSGPPFRWDEERRFLLRCELDAAFFHLYLGPQSEWQQQPEALTRAFPTPRHAVSYIMDTFPIVKRKDETKHGHYRTQQTILQIYDALTESIATGQPYQTLLNPPPADPACCHPPRKT